MDANALHIAWILGPYYVVAGLWVLANQDAALKLMSEMKKPANGMLLYFGAVVSLLMGLTILSFYREWTQSTEVLVTITGWLAVLKGLGLFFNPKAVTNMKFSKNTLSVLGVVLIVVGAILANAAFGIV